MASAERQPSFGRKAEVAVEKYGGIGLVGLGVLAWELGPVGIGAALYLLSRARDPKGGK